jgi:hypothetical protein
MQNEMDPAGQSPALAYGGDQDIQRIISNALNRKTVSVAYHTAVPQFLKSQGPFTVYDHAMHKGERVKNINGSVNNAALDRYTQEIEHVKNCRNKEKETFYNNISHELSIMDAQRKF